MTHSLLEQEKGFGFNGGMGRCPYFPHPHHQFIEGPTPSSPPRQIESTMAMVPTIEAEDLTDLLLRTIC